MSGKDEIRCFISCSLNVKDYATVKELAAQIKKTGAKVILENGNINVGSSAEREVFHKIAGCTHFLPIIGVSDLNAYSDSGNYLRRKLDYAIQNGKKIIPILVDGLDYSASQSQIPVPLKKLQSGISYSLSKKTLAKVSNDLINTLPTTSPNAFANTSFENESSLNARPFNATPANTATSSVGNLPASGFFSSLSESTKNFSPWLYLLIAALLLLLFWALLNGFNNTNTNNINVNSSPASQTGGIKSAEDTIPPPSENGVPNTQVQRGSSSIVVDGEVIGISSGGGSHQISVTSGDNNHVQQQQTNSSVHIKGSTGGSLSINSSNIQIQNKGMRGVFSNEDEKDFDIEPPSDMIKKIPKIKPDKSDDNDALPDSCNTD